MSRLLNWIVFPVIAFLIAHQIWTTYQERKDSQTWPETKGYLVSSHVKEVSEDSTDARGYTSTNHYFTVEVNYDYNIAGNWYRGNRSRIGGLHFSRESEAMTHMQKLQATKTLVVYYNPKDPRKSTLVR